MSDTGQWVIAADTREGFGLRAREIWRYRRVIWFFARNSMSSLYAKTHLGPLWIVIRKLVPILTSTFVFGQVMQVPTGGVPYFIFFMAGQLPWDCFDGPLIRASRGLDSNRQLLTKLYVPRMILPLGSMAPGLVDPVIGLVLLVVGVLYYRQADGVWYVNFGPRLLIAVACLALILMFTISLSLVTSVLQARARDARFVLRYVLGFWVYFTPVIYPLSKVPEKIRWVAYINPLTAPIETFKWTFLPGMQHSWEWLGYSAVVTMAVFCFGVWFFDRSESATVDSL